MSQELDTTHHYRYPRLRGCVIPQLPVSVIAPALGGTVRQQRTRMEIAG